MFACFTHGMGMNSQHNHPQMFRHSGTLNILVQKSTKQNKLIFCK